MEIDFSLSMYKTLKAIFTDTGSLLKKGWDKGKAQYNTKDPLGFVAKQYTDKIYGLYNNVKVLGMQKPMPLSDLYVYVNVLHSVRAREYRSFEEMTKDIDFLQRNYGKIKEEHRPASELVRNRVKFIVLGKPGAGKTTLLKHICLKSIEDPEHYGKAYIPIFISLKAYSDSGQSLFDYLADQFVICQINDPEGFFKTLLQSGNCRILLDGLDEVSKDKKDVVIREMKRFCDTYGGKQHYKEDEEGRKRMLNDFEGNQIIISSRVAAYNNFFDHFEDIEVADFGTKQIKRFVKHWFAAEKKDTGKDTGKECLEQIMADKAIKDLATNPLLLTLLCISFNKSYTFPKKRADLYRSATDALLQDWDASRRIKRQGKSVYLNLSLREKENLFSTVAYETFKNEEYILPRATMEDYIQQYIQNFSDIDGDKHSKFVLQDIESCHGILLQRAANLFSFSHLTFQEYFTAKYIVDYRDEGTLNQLLQTKYLTDSKWREVFLLVAGLLPNAAIFLIPMSYRVNELAKSNDNTLKIVEALPAIIKKESKYRPEARRILSIYYLLTLEDKDKNKDKTTLALGLGIALFLTLGFIFILSRTSNPINKRSLIHDIDPNLDLDLDRDYDSTLNQILNHDLAYGLNYKLEPNPKFFSHITSYLQATQLLVDCLKVAYIRPDEREGILGRLLTLEGL